MPITCCTIPLPATAALEVLTGMVEAMCPVCKASYTINADTFMLMAKPGTTPRVICDSCEESILNDEWDEQEAKNAAGDRPEYLDSRDESDPNHPCNQEDSPCIDWQGFDSPSTY